MEAHLEHAHVAYALFPRFGTDLHAQSVLSDRVYASELRRMFIKSALLVGQAQKQERQIAVFDLTLLDTLTV